MESQTSEKGQLPSYQDIPTDAKEDINSKTPAALEAGRQSSTPPSAPGRKMANYRRTILFLSFTWLVLYGVALAGENRLRWQKGCHKAKVSDQQSEAEPETSTESSSFAALLNGASPKSLHDLLHRHLPRQFQDGVWESEHHAVRAVHEADPALASSIVQLAKRQDNNSTTASTSESSSSAAPSTSSTEPSTRPTPTTTPSSTPSTSTSTSIITTSSRTSTTSTTSVRTSATPTETTLTTSTVTSPEETSTTSTTSRSSRPIVTTFTSTSNGNVVTITSTTFVDAEETGLPATTTRAIPGLQNSAPQQQRGSLLAGVIAVVAMLMA